METVALEEMVSQLNSKVYELEQAQQKTLEVAINSMRVKQTKYEYIILTDFGYNFAPSLGAKTMGNLMRLVGLAQESKEKTVPYRRYVPDYCKSGVVADFTQFYWHYTKCLKHIDKWLKNNNLYERFYSFKDEAQLEKFINNLYMDKKNTPAF